MTKPRQKTLSLAKRLFFNREWTRSDANETEHSFSLREKVAVGRMRVSGEFQGKAKGEGRVPPRPKNHRTRSPSPRPSPAGRGSRSIRGSVVECGSLHRFFLEVFSFKFSVLSSSKPCPSCSSMFPFLQSLIRPRKAAGTAALQDAPATCLLYTSPSPRDGLLARMPSSA